MIRQELLDIVRCPISPKRDVALEMDVPSADEEGGELPKSRKPALVCERCRVRFPIKEGFPSLVKEDAKLPDDCDSMADLPCQQDKEDR